MRKAACLTILLTTAGLAGCGTQDAPGAAESELAQGLTVLDATDTSLSVAFRRDDRVIFAEALRGEATPEPYQSDALSPAFQMDARFLSADGYTFYSQQGGDTWLDESWGEDRDAQSALPPTTESNAWMFELATELAAELPSAVAQAYGPDGAAQHEPEMHVLLAFGEDATQIFSEQMAFVRDEARAAAAGELPGSIDGEVGGDVAYGDLGGADAASTYWAANRYYMSLHTGSISYASFCGGYHSATRLYEVRNGAWASVHDNANHGRGPSDSSMANVGHIGAHNRPAWTLRTCGTGYDALSNGSGHNCHDDSRIQMNNLALGTSVGGTALWCNNGDHSSDFSCGTESGHPSPDSRGQGRAGYNYATACQYNFNNTSCPSSYQGTGDGCDCGCVFPDGTGADPDCRARY